MPKLTHFYTCPWCGTEVPTMWGLRVHFRRKESCSYKRENDYFTFQCRVKKSLPIPLIVPLHISSHRTRLRTGQLSRQVPEPRNTCQPPSRESANGGPPVCKGNGQQVEASSSETHIPSIHPNPPCQPPHPSIHEESHPDPTAGGVLRWEEFEDEPGPRYDPMWFDKVIFEKGEWLGMEGLSKGARRRYFEQENPGIPWKNIRQYRQDTDHLPHGPDWKTYRVTAPDASGRSWTMYARNPIEIVKQLFGNRGFKQCLRYAPVRHWMSDKRRNRLYSKVWTADAWWRMQNALGWGRGATIATVILSSDKTQLSQMTGNKKAWPVYLTLGNISNSTRRRPSEHANVLLGYIPITDLGGEDEWQFFHDCMARILEPLKQAGRTGVEIRCADGGVRLIFPIVSAYVGDFPEQCLVACARESSCPICLTPKAGRGDGYTQHEPRERSEILTAMNREGRERVQALQSMKIRPTRPFWEDLPFTDISAAITPDLLHQLNKGVFGDHLVNWVTKLLGKDRLDNWLMGIPRASGVRHFLNGKSGVKQWSGKEMKELAKVFMSVAAGCTEEDAVVAARHLLNFIYRAHLPQMSDDDLERLEEDLAGFHDVKGTLLNLGCLDTENGPTKDGFDGIPKIHMLGHYVHVIRELGTTNNFNTEATERLHIEYVKCGWRASNHRNEIPQMAKYLQRREAWVLLRTYLDESGHLPKEDDTMDTLDAAPNGLGEKGNPGLGQDGGRFEVVPAHSRNIGPVHVWRDDLVWYPRPRISTANDRSHTKRSGADLIRIHGTTRLIEATQDFLERHTGSRSH